MRQLLAGALVGVFCLGSGAALAAEAKVPAYDWSFEGVFGRFDRAAMQRGLQVYREVCSGCHSLRLIAFRNLAALGYDEAEITEIAGEYSVIDGPDDEGEMFERQGRPSDRFPPPFPNAKAAAAANNGAVPPDLSLMAKARKGGPSYIRALLTGYEEPPADFELLEGLNYNAYFPGAQIAMPPPLFEDAVEYQDGTPASPDQMASDVATFLMWTAEPDLETRKRMGIKVILFLLVFTGVLYATKRKVWADIH
ncbi:MAG: cytochrome c1 [Kiloniellaceae bacterium]